LEQSKLSSFLDVVWCIHSPFRFGHCNIVVQGVVKEHAVLLYKRYVLADPMRINNFKRLSIQSNDSLARIIESQKKLPKGAFS
jgi:hypothetical protein